MEEEYKLSPELKDIVEMIYRYNAVHQNNTAFVYHFVSFKKDPQHKCIDCGEECDNLDEEGTMIGAYGDKDMLITLINALQEMIILEQDEDEFVNC
jgi:hypothetical protein